MVHFKKNKAGAETPQRELPQPVPLSMTLQESLNNRRTTRDFSEDPISDEQLTAILWAADGVNRRDGKKTTPSAMNWQEIDLYVVKANGVWLWKPESTRLDFVRATDLRDELCLYQPMIKRAPVHLVYVAQTLRTKNLVSELAMTVLKLVDKKNAQMMSESMMSRAQILDAGVKVQAAYLACAALNIGCVARLTFEPERVHSALRLQDSQVPVVIQSIGYKASSLLDRVM